MLKIDIPGFKKIEAEHLVLDYDGTIAIDGRFISGIIGKLIQISTVLKIHIMAAESFGTAQIELKGLPIIIKKLEPEKQDQQKLNYVRSLGPMHVIAIGNGKDDSLVFRDSALSIGVIQTEGAYSPIIFDTHVICTSINDALSLLVSQKRLMATLRS